MPPHCQAGLKSLHRGKQGVKRMGARPRPWPDRRGGEADGSRPRAFYQQRADYAGSRSAAEPYICSIRLVPLLFMTGGGDKFDEGVSGLLFRIVHELDRIVRRFSRLPSAAEYGILFLENLAAG